MKNVLKIFKSDLHGLLTNFFALVIAGGLCLLPALYAWFNIYANWDPYSNTGNIKIAVVNLDEGWTKSDGEFVNMGEGIEDSLREKDSIGWCFLDKEDEAVDGVKAGDYYAALIIDEDFTYGMYNGIAESIDNPRLTYYVNDKKNAVATKITDTAVSTVQSSINKQFVEVVATSIFKETNEISDDIKNSDKIDQIISKIKGVSDTLSDYDRMISTFMTANQQMMEVSTDAGDSLARTQKSLSEGVNELEEKRGELTKSKTSFTSYSTDVSDTMDTIKKSLNTITKELEDAKLDQDAAKLARDVNKIDSDLDVMSHCLDDLYEKLSKLADTTSDSKIASALKTIENMKKLSDSTSDAINVSKLEATTSSAVGNIITSLASYSDTVKQIQNMFDNQVVPQVNEIFDQMSDTLLSVEDLINSLSSTADGMNDVFAGVGTTLDTMNLSLVELQSVLGKTNESLSKVLDKLDGANESEKVDILVDFLGGNPDSMGAFLSQPVLVSENYIYPISNYGSGVTPFYTTLAIWVGMTILVSLIKVHANAKSLEGAITTQLFFGRYLTFFLLSQIQTLIIVIGDLYWLKVQCLNPFAFWGAAAMASLTFSLIIYSLTIAFGDIGKAAAVVIMVLQIAGSGGTYPIEALPAFFRGVYFFFPFPYAINAMRECIGGMYENNYYVYLSELVIFCVGALVVGLIIRVPFIKLNHFIEKRMEDTKML